MTPTLPRTPEILLLGLVFSVAGGLALCQSALAQSESFRTERFPTGLSLATPRAASRQTATSLPLYAIDDGANDGSGTLYRIGTSAKGGTVEVAVVGETGVRNIWDIAFVGTRLYGIVGSNDRLYEIDPQTAITTLVQDFNIPSQPNALIAESPTTLLTATSALGQLWRIDLELLTAELIGEYGDARSSGDLAFDQAGRLLATVERGTALTDLLVEVDPMTGAARPIGDLLFQQVYGLALDPATATLYGVVDSELSPKLVVINRVNGSPTVIGSIPVANGVTGLAICGQCLFDDDFETGGLGAWSGSVP